MLERKLTEFGDEYTDICLHLEERLKTIANVYKLSWKTPPHDIVVWIMNEIVEFEEVKI